MIVPVAVVVVVVVGGWFCCGCVVMGGVGGYCGVAGYGVVLLSLCRVVVSGWCWRRHGGGGGVGAVVVFAVAAAADHLDISFSCSRAPNRSLS